MLFEYFKSIPSTTITNSPLLLLFFNIWFLTVSGLPLNIFSFNFVISLQILIFLSLICFSRVSRQFFILLLETKRPQSENFFSKNLKNHSFVCHFLDKILKNKTHLMAMKIVVKQV